MILKFDKIYSVNERSIEVDEYYLNRDLGLFNNIQNIFIDNGYEKDYRFYTVQSWR